MSKVQAQFDDLPIGARFTLRSCPTDLMKVSSRTARWGGNGGLVWMPKYELVTCDEEYLKEGM